MNIHSILNDYTELKEGPIKENLIPFVITELYYAMHEKESV